MIAKTNAMRQLDEKGIPYQVYQIEMEGFVSGLHQAETAGQDPETMFKTLVLKTKEERPIVCLIPVCCQLDTKKIASYMDTKKMCFLKEEELLNLTGYTHGQTSPLGMKTRIPEVIHESALKHDLIIINGGGIGLEIEIAPTKLMDACDAVFINIIKE